MKIICSSIISLVAIAAIAFIEYHALKAGIDGALFMSSLTIVGGLAGYQIKTVKTRIELKAIEDGKRTSNSNT